MIDPVDRQTQPLALDEPKPAKRGRGRPSTGQALSNAERQRRYRENLKAQRNEKMHQGVAEDLRAELAKALDRIEELESQLTKAKAKAAKAGPTKRRYILQWQDPVKGTWHDDSTGDYGSKAKANEACKRMNEKGFSQGPWRVRERQWV